MVSAVASAVSFWEEEDLSFFLMQSIDVRFKRQTEAENRYLQPQSMHALVSSFAEVLTEYTPRKITASRWEKLLWSDTKSRKEIKAIHAREIEEFKTKQTLLLKSAELLLVAFRRCLDGSFGEKVKEELICMSPLFCTVQGILRLLCIEAVLSKETLQNMEVFSDVPPVLLQRARRQLKALSEEQLASLLLDRGQGAAAETLCEVVKLAYSKLDFLDLSKERMRAQKSRLIEQLVNRHLSVGVIAKLIPSSSQGSLDRSIDRIGGCPPGCTLCTPCATTLVRLYQMMSDESEPTVGEQAKIFLAIRDHKTALGFASTLERPESREFYLRTLLVQGLDSPHSRDIVKGALSQIEAKDAFMGKLRTDLDAEEKKVLVNLINEVVEKRVLKLELRKALCGTS